MGFPTRKKKNLDETTTSKTASALSAGLVRLILAAIAFFIYLLAFLVPTQLVLIGVVPFLSSYFLTSSSELGTVDVVMMYTVAGVCLFAWYELYAKLCLKVAHRANAWTKRWILEGRLDSKKVD